MLPITWVFDTSWLRRNAHLYKSQALLYDALVHLRTLSLLSSFFPWSCGSAYISSFVLIFLLSGSAVFFSFKGCVFVYTASAEQIASSCSSTCNTCNTAGCTHHDASRVDALLEDVVSSSQAPPSTIPIGSAVGSSHSALGPLDGLWPNYTGASASDFFYLFNASLQYLSFITPNKFCLFIWYLKLLLHLNNPIILKTMLTINYLKFYVNRSNNQKNY